MSTTPSIRPRRSVLYMPGANARAMEKARSLDCDAIIFDLEDAVAPDAKTTAREQVVAAVRSGGYGHREVVVRVNALESPWGRDDVAAVAGLPIDAILFPKIESAAQVGVSVSAVDAAGGGALPLWAMIETPRGALSLERIAASSARLTTLVMGTSDLVKDLRARHMPDRASVLHALSACVLVARAYDRTALDGVYLDLEDAAGFRAVCEQGRALGFDGKTLIHPSQIAAANAAFGPSDADVADAHAVVAAWQEAQRAGKGVAVLRGRLIENLHAAEAERVIAFATAVARNTTAVARNTT